MNITPSFQALAYPATNLADPISPCPCSLVFRCDGPARKATVLLVAQATQTFVLQYDANELVSDTGGLGSGNRYLTQPQLDELMRDKADKRPDIKTLTLTLKQPCPLWCSDSPSIAYQPGFEPSFQHFVDLAKATTIHIVFDYKFLPKKTHGMLKALSQAARDLVGYPVQGLLTDRGLRKASWEVFGPVDAVEAPPVYENSRKRPLQTIVTPPRQSQKCFALQSPTYSSTSGTTIPDSPATAAALNAAFSNPPVPDDSAKWINGGVSKQLSAHLDKVLPNLLSDILPTLFGNCPPDSNHTESQSSLDSLNASAPKLPLLMPLGQLLLPHLRIHLADQFQRYQDHELRRFLKLLDRLWDSAEGAWAHENAEMEEYMEEHKTDMMLLKNDAIKELSDEVDAVFAKGREEARDLGDELTGRLESVFMDTYDVIERLKRTRLKKMVEIEVKKQDRQRKLVSRGRGKTRVGGHPKLLGRRREVDLQEWVDC